MAMVTREVHLDARALPDLAVDLHVAARLLDEAIDLAQAKAGSVPRLLGREERLERMIENLWRHAGTRVTDTDDDILPGRDLRICARIVVICGDVRRLDRQLPAIWHRVARVDRQIDDGRLQMVHVRLNLPESGATDGLDLDAFAERALKKFLEATQEAVQVDWLRIESLTPREGEQPAGQRGRALGSALCVCQRAMQVGSTEVAAVALGVLQVSQNDHQQIVEVVCNATAQLSDRLELLRCHKLFLDTVKLILCLLALGQVARDLGKADDGAALIGDPVDDDGGPKAR